MFGGPDMKQEYTFLRYKKLSTIVDIWRSALVLKWTSHEDELAQRTPSSSFLPFIPKS